MVANWLVLICMWPLFYAVLLLPAVFPFLVLHFTANASPTVVTVLRVVLGFPTALWIVAFAPRLAFQAAQLSAFEYESFSTSLSVTVFGAPLGIGSYLHTAWLRLRPRSSPASTETRRPEALHPK